MANVIRSIADLPEDRFLQSRHGLPDRRRAPIVRLGRYPASRIRIVGISLTRYRALFRQQLTIGLGDFAAGGDLQFRTGEHDPLVNRIRRDSQQARNLFRGLVLNEQVEHFALLRG